MLGMLNLSLMLALLGTGSGLALIVMYRLRWQLALVIFAEFLLSRLCYLAACVQAVDYSATVRVAFDLYRFDLLKQMHVPLPDSLFKERLLWDALNRWVYSYSPPWQSSDVPDFPAPARPFINDTHSPPDKPAQPLEVILRIKRDRAEPSVK